MRKNFVYNLIMVALIATLISACGGGAPADGDTASSGVPAEYAGKVNSFADSSDAVSEGKAIFDTTCAACHGNTGLGDGPAAVSLTPSPASFVELNKTATDDYLLWRISEGKEGTAMVGWKTSLSEDQIWQVISYVRTLK